MNRLSALRSASVEVPNVEPEKYFILRSSTIIEASLQIVHTFISVHQGVDHGLSFRETSQIKKRLRYHTRTLPQIPRNP